MFRRSNQMKNKNNVISVNFGSNKRDDLSSELLEIAEAISGDGFLDEQEKENYDEVVTATVNTSISGNNNIVGNSNNITIKAPARPRINIILSDKSISSETAYKLKLLIDRLVKADDPRIPTQVLYPKWWSVLRKRYKVTSYKEIPRNKGADAIKHLKHHLNIKNNAGYKK